MHAVAAHTTDEGSVAVKAWSQVISLGGLRKLVQRLSGISTEASRTFVVAYLSLETSAQTCSTWVHPPAMVTPYTSHVDA